MKKILLVLMFAMNANVNVFAQFVDGSIMPNWTMKDMDGVTWDLYTLLGQGKTVILDMSATWCHPCWNYHNSHELRKFYEQYGPKGTVAKNKAMVFMLEADCATNDACITHSSGCNKSSQGNWTLDTPYPILNPANPLCSPILKPYHIGGYPEVYMVCPDKKGYKLGQPTASTLATKVKNNCNTITNVESTNSIDNTLSIFPNPANEFINIEYQCDKCSRVTINIYNMIGEKLISTTRETGAVGTQKMTVDTKNLNTGIYIVELRSEGYSSTRKISINE